MNEKGRHSSCSPPSVISILSKSPKQKTRRRHQEKSGLDLALAGVAGARRMSHHPDGEDFEIDEQHSGNHQFPPGGRNVLIRTRSSENRLSSSPNTSRNLQAVGVSFALKEEEEEEEEKAEITSDCSPNGQQDHPGDDHAHNEDDKSINSNSLAMPDIDMEEDGHDEEGDTDEVNAQLMSHNSAELSSHSIAEEEEESTSHLMEDIRQALRAYAVPRARQGPCSQASSDFWKGLLVGLFLCQAVFVPLWASYWSGVGTNRTGSMMGFLSLLLRRLIVGTVAGAGFVIIAVIAIEYDKALHQEIEELRLAKSSRDEISFQLNQAERRQLQRPNRSRRRRTQSRRQQPTPESLEEERNHINRSVSVTAPCSSSNTGFAEEEGASRQHKEDDEDRNELLLPDLNEMEEQQVVTCTPVETSQPIVQGVPDAIFESTEKSLSLGALDLSENDTLLTPSHCATNANLSTQNQGQSYQSTADFYPDATVLLAHISGFTAWSSQRSPYQVFTLLEKLHQRFDQAAQLSEITKLETTSESYMAVTGVPLPQPDHALRMVKFAKQITQSTVTIVTALESTLGPGTMDLRLRIGVHSGSILALSLGGRLQVFGNTVSIASSMESTSHRSRIQVSEATADLIRKAEKADWIQKREDHVVATKGVETQTYFVVVTAPLSAPSRSGKQGYQCQQSSMSLRSMRSVMSGASSSAGSTIPRRPTDQTPKVPKRRKVWDDGEDNFILSLPPMSRTAKNKRLIGWVIRLLETQLKKIVAQRGTTAANGFEISDEVLSRVCHGAIPVEEVVDFIEQASAEQASDRSTISGEVAEAKLDANVSSQLREMVTNLASLYREDNPFSNFEHASHVAMSVQKLLDRCIAHDDEEFESSSKSLASRSASRPYMSSVASDALCQFAILFAALAHNCGHQGLSNSELSKLNPKLSEDFEHESVAEQNSINQAWSTLMDPALNDLRQCLFCSEAELKRFRQVLVNTVLATDLFNGRAQSLRNRRWDRAFEHGNDSSVIQEEDVDLKATVVLECLVQASAISHSMQDWKAYQKYSERLFREKCIAFDAGRSSSNPAESWFEEEKNFFDKYTIPLAKKLSEAKVFGVASSECLNHALENRKVWAQKGDQMVQEMFKRYCKRKDMEIGGFTNEEINNFTHKELEYIIKKLIEKGRNRGSNEVDEEKGQIDAAQAWLDALEIYERCPAAMEISDRSIIFPIYSGVYIWIKGGKIQQDLDGYFELNLASKFVRESKLHCDPIHHSRGLAMLCEVYGRQGNYQAALGEFEKLKDIYSLESHSLAVAEVYGTDRSAMTFSFSALWHDQLGNKDKATAACEYVIQDMLPLMDPTNTLGNFELLLNVIRVMKPKGQEKRMKQLLEDYILTPFLKHHGPNGFTPCMPLFKPLPWLLDLCADPANFHDLDAAVEWLTVESNGLTEEFLDTMYAKSCWAPHDMVAELCLRLANRLALEEGDREKQRFLVQKGLMLAWRSEKKMRDLEGNIVLAVANEMHEPVFNALCAVSKHMGISCAEADQPKQTRKTLDVNLPPSYLKGPENGIES